MKKSIIGAIAVVALLAMGMSAFANTFDDVIVARSGSGWYLSNNPGSPGYYKPPGAGPVGPVAVSSQLIGYGGATAQQIVGDVNGDGIDDVVSVQDGFNSIFYSSHSSIGAGGVGALGNATTDSTANGLGLPAGRAGAFIGDVNGDGYGDAIAVDSGFYFRSSHSTASGLSLSQDSVIQWGSAAQGDIPLIGDFNGDGKTDAALYRGGGAADWYINKSTVAGIGGGGTAITDFGLATDIPLVGDFNGDGRDDGVLVRPDVNGNFQWYVGFSDATGAVAGDGFVSTGANRFGGTAWSDTPFVADINGDGLDDLGVYRDDGAGNWYFLTSFTGAGGDISAPAIGNHWTFGLSATDTPLFGDFNVVPEPATLGMLLIGGAGLWIRKRFMI